jgi:hypothetical protein
MIAMFLISFKVRFVYWRVILIKMLWLDIRSKVRVMLF